MARLGVERKADELYRSVGGEIGLGVLLLVYLLERPVNRLAHLQLENVDALLVRCHDVGMKWGQCLFDPHQPGFCCAPFPVLVRTISCFAAHHL